VTEHRIDQGLRALGVDPDALDPDVLAALRDAAPPPRTQRRTDPPMDRDTQRRWRDSDVRALLRSAANLGRPLPDAEIEAAGLPADAARKLRAAGEVVATIREHDGAPEAHKLAESASYDIVAGLPETWSSPDDRARIGKDADVREIVRRTRGY
jgi:hypothetical protein